VRAGAYSPLSGIIHAGFLLLFLLVAARLASFVPLAALAGVLVVVCWNMTEKKEVIRLFGEWGSAAVMITSFALTLVRDPTTGIVAGCLLAALFAALERRAPREG
jgi:SulP family sulfate permease